jgi:hypothetical protein
MDWGSCLAILALHGAGPQMLCLIHNFWDTATNVCRAKGNYSQPFKASRGVTQAPVPQNVGQQIYWYNDRKNIFKN